MLIQQISEALKSGDEPVHCDNIYFKLLLLLAVVLFQETVSVSQYHWDTIQGSQNIYPQMLYPLSSLKTISLITGSALILDLYFPAETGFGCFMVKNVHSSCSSLTEAQPNTLQTNLCL